MKILFIVDNYMGGAGNIIQLLATEYAKKDDVTVLLTNKTIEKRYECKGVKFVELDAKDKPSGIKAVTFQIKWIKKQIKAVQPDVVISFLTKNSIFVCLGHMRSKIPIIACERINPFDTVMSFPWNTLMKISYDRAELITVQFESFSTFSGGRYVDKCRVTPNYIAKPDRFKDMSVKREITRFVSCGRLNDSKQFEVLIDMFAEIHKREPKTELHIYGHGPYEERLNKQINELGLSDSAKLMGYTNDTYGVLCDADVYLMSSKSEGFPNALSEAMAVGLPSVSFRCNGGIDELCDNGRRGAVVALNDKDAFIEAALELCHNEEKCREYSKNALEVSDVYSMEKIKAIWDDCIKEAIEKKRKKK